jgi:hypothetical protein
MRSATYLAIMLALALPGPAMGHPCEEGVAKAQAALESASAYAALSASSPIYKSPQQVLQLQAEIDRMERALDRKQAECSRLMEEERARGTKGGASATGCSKDTDCKGDRVCVSGSCQSSAPVRAAAPTERADPIKDLELTADPAVRARAACRLSVACEGAVNYPCVAKANGVYARACEIVPREPICGQRVQVHPNCEVGLSESK